MTVFFVARYISVLAKVGEVVARDDVPFVSI
jgi:hypothetical protein